MDQWFEEDEEVFVHARDPYTRLDILPSSRRVRVEIDGVTVADSINGISSMRPVCRRVTTYPNRM